MPITGTHVACAAAIKTARDAARDAYIAIHTPPLSSVQVLEMAQKMQEAEEEARILHWVANVAVATSDVGTATGAVAGGPGVPVVATGTGTIS